MSVDLSAPADRELFERGTRTLIQSWAHFATGSPGGRVIETGDASIGVFTHDPDRLIFNNTVLHADADRTPAALDVIAATYAAAGIERYAVWVHEAATATADAVKAHGYAYDDSTRVMGMRLEDLAEPDVPAIELGEPDFQEFLRINGLPGTLFPALGPGAHLHLARLDGVNVAAVMAFDWEGDCGIYNVATVPEARRRGIGTALTLHALRRARERGCTTASLQSTAMAEGVYGALGFRDLGRFDEYVPAS